MSILFADKGRWNQLRALVDYFGYSPEKTRNKDNVIAFELHTEPDDLKKSNFQEQITELLSVLDGWADNQTALAVHDILANDPLSKDAWKAKYAKRTIEQGIVYAARISEKLKLSHIIFNLHLFNITRWNELTDKTETLDRAISVVQDIYKYIDSENLGGFVIPVFENNSSHVDLKTIGLKSQERELQYYAGFGAIPQDFMYLSKKLGQDFYTTIDVSHMVTNILAYKLGYNHLIAENTFYGNCDETLSSVMSFMHAMPNTVHYHLNDALDEIVDGSIIGGENYKGEFSNGKADWREIMKAVYKNKAINFPYPAMAVMEIRGGHKDINRIKLSYDHLNGFV